MHANKMQNQKWFHDKASATAAAAFLSFLSGCIVSYAFESNIKLCSYVVTKYIFFAVDWIDDILGIGYLND